MSRMVLGLCVTILLPAWLPAAEPPERLLEQLGNSRHKERQQAAAALLQQGSAVIPLLEKARGHKDLEVRRQVEALLEHLIPRAEAEQILAAPKFRLNYKDVPAAEALGDFARKTRLPLALDTLDRIRLSRKRITVQTEELPLWEAYLKLCAAAGVAEIPTPADSTVTLLSTIEPTPPPSRGGGSPGSFSGRSPASVRRPTLAPLVIAPVPGASLPTAYSGALRIQAVDSAMPRNPGGDMKLPLVFSTSERIRLIEVEYLRVERAVDIFGQKVRTPGYALELPAPIQPELEFRVEERPPGRYLPPCQVDLTFHVPNRRVKLLEELTGFVGIRVEAPPGPLVEVPDVVKASETTLTGRDGTTVKIVSAVLDPDTKRLRIKIEVQRPEGVSDPPPPNGRGGFGGRGGATRSSNSLTRSELEQQGIEAFDGKGEAVSLWRAELAPRRDPPGPREFTLVYEPTKDQAATPIRLVVSGKRLALVEVPFTLRNVPLP